MKRMNYGEFEQYVKENLTILLPEEFADLLARQLGSPRAMDRMTSYILSVHPDTEEMLVDEMLAICDDINAWREKKRSQEAQANYNATLFYRRGVPADDEDDA